MAAEMNAEEYFKSDERSKKLDEATALVIALALGRESPTRTDYANPRFKEIRRIIEQAGGGR